jgi:archaellum component FlaC
MTELQRRLTQMTEQSTEQKKQIAGAKAQMTRVRTEMKEITESTQVLRTALTVKTFQLTELQNELKELKEQKEQSYIHLTPSTAKIRPRNLHRWAAPFQSLLKKNFSADACEARIL